MDIPELGEFNYRNKHFKCSFYRRIWKENRFKGNCIWYKWCNRLLSDLPQGAVLSTTLFTIYISDMPHPPHAQLALYTDDTALLTQSWRTDTIVRRLTHTLTTFHRYFTKWKLQVNINKTVAILFTKRRPPTPHHYVSTAPTFPGALTSGTWALSWTQNSFLRDI